MAKTLKRYERYYQPCGHYGGVIGALAKKDFLRHQNWYFNWLKYIGRKVGLEPYRAQKVIDLGGGIGAFCELLLAAGFQDVTCNDISAEALRLAKKFNSKLPTVRFDVEEWEAESAYDLIFAFEVLEHFSKPEVTIKKIFQALKKDGLFVGTTPYPFPKAFNDPTHQHVWRPEKWQQLFRQAGFSPVDTYPMSFPPLLYRFHRSLNFCLPWYIKNQYFVSTSLIVAHKDE